MNNAQRRSPARWLWLIGPAGFTWFAARAWTRVLADDSGLWPNITAILATVLALASWVSVVSNLRRT